MKFNNSAFSDIHELAGNVTGKPVWIAGSDPTLDTYPADFFDDKVGMTLHLAHLKFPRATYRYSSEYDRSKFLLHNRSEYAQLPLIAAWPMYGKTKKETELLLKDSSIVFFHRMINYLPTGVRGEIDEKFTFWKVKRTLRNRASVWGSHGSCLHTCIYVALLLGASEIHVIGAGHGFVSTGNLDHFGMADSIHQNMRTGDTFSNPKIAVPVIEQTLALKKACEANGVPFYWHETYTPEMDRFISVSTEALADLQKKARRHFSLIRRLYWLLWKRPLHRMISLF